MYVANSPLTKGTGGIFIQLINVGSFAVCIYESGLKSIKFESEKCKIVHNQ